LGKIKNIKDNIMENDKEDKMSKQEYLAAQHEYEASMDHFDEDGFCVFCSRHQDEGIHYKCWI
tara:strand:- start:648 stop:836 length:189 start_codon:yes stop_codon:yes gene_type:complete